MTTENNFDEMTASALSNIDEAITKTPEKQEPANPYKLNQVLLDDGFMYDFNGVYVPFKEEFQRVGVDYRHEDNFETRDDIYLYISRNPDKKLEINFKWAKKNADGFHHARGFNIDFLLDIGDEKDLKALNKKVAFSGGKNGNPATQGTYVSFVEYLTDMISEADCLDVFKEKDFIFPEPEDTDSDNDVEFTEMHPQCFADYPEKIQHEALQILKEGDVFKSMQESVSLTHYGHTTTRDALILMESSVFVDDGAHGLLGGESGGGKTDLALTCALNLPSKHVHIISSNSPKDIFYDFDSYDDEFNILVFDDIVLTEELIKLIKLLTDNRVKEKIHKTVINGKAVTFKLKGKYEVVLTYAKEVPDEELANRLFNIGVTIIDKGKGKDGVKYKIRDNKATKGNDNPFVMYIQTINRACVQYLLEHLTLMFNPYLSIYDPLNFNNRDINHLASMTNARTFFDLNKRRQIRLNDETVLTLGSIEDLKFVYDIWARDEEAQKYKLSELQKQALDILPEYTDAEAFEKVEKLNDELQATESRQAKKKLLEDAPLLKSLSKQLGKTPSTLRRALDNYYEGNKKALCEIGLVDKIKLDEDKEKSPNFYYKVKNNAPSLNSTSSHVHNVHFAFEDTFHASMFKQKIIIDLLLYSEICINKRGVGVLQKYCEEEHVEFDLNDYDLITDFLQGFFDTLNYEEHVIKPEDVTRADMLEMFKFQENIFKGLYEKIETPPSPTYDKVSEHTTENPENAPDTKRGNVQSSNYIMNIANIFEHQIKEFLDEKHIDMFIASQTYTFLTSKKTATTQDIINYIHETVPPEDAEQTHLAMKIDTHLNRMFMNDLLDFNGNKYELTPEFVNLVERGEYVEA